MDTIRTITATVLTPTGIIPRTATATAIKATDTAIKATDTAIKATAMAIKATAMAIKATATAIKATATAIKATATAIDPRLRSYSVDWLELATITARSMESWDQGPVVQFAPTNVRTAHWVCANREADC